MATKPLFYEGMTARARFRALFWIVVVPLVLLAILIGGYLLPRSSSSTDRQQQHGESDYEYHQRIQAEDKQDSRDCGYKPAC